MTGRAEGPVRKKSEGRARHSRSDIRQSGDNSSEEGQWSEYYRREVLQAGRTALLGVLKARNQ